MRLLVLTCAAAAMLCGADPATAAGSAAPAATQQTQAQPWLGVGLVEVDDAVAYHLGLERDLGVLLDQVAPDSPAAQAGLRRFDVVVALDGADIYTPRAFTAHIQKLRPGAAVRLAVRRGGERTEITATLGERPRGAAGMTAPGPGLPPEAQRLLERMREQRDGDSPRRGRVQTPNGVLEWSTSDDRPAQEF
ncbi:MAG: putative periplasmic serine endoprotease DegP-like precursor [Planctomycetota bacterium]|jgi:predicted metalloprotease with PDZ domain